MPRSDKTTVHCGKKGGTRMPQLKKIKVIASNYEDYYGSSKPMDKQESDETGSPLADVTTADGDKNCSARSESKEHEEPQLANASITSSLGELKPEETFVTIQTKGGINSQQISLAKFVQQMVVDKTSGGITLDLEKLFTGTGMHPENESQNRNNVVLGSTSTTENKSSNEIILTKQKEDCRVKADEVANHTPSKQPPKVSRGRGRPRKVKPVNDASSSQSNSFESVDPVWSDRKVAVSTNFPRRSRRTPARNNRFDDYVDSTTLGKSFSWNTQLMTLALAAERHENKPSATLERETKHGAEEAGEESLLESGDSDENLQPGMDDNSDSGERNWGKKRKTDSGVTIRGPKTLKKYEPVKPVVKRSLKAALELAQAASSNLLTSDSELPVAEDGSNPKAYYTIMEPKTEPSGHGLLVQKSGEGLKFNIANFTSTVADSSFFQIRNSYPQDRYFACDLCEQMFASSSQWLQHNKTAHSHSETVPTEEPSGKKEVFTCQFCSQRFPHAFMLDIHMKRRQHGEGKSLSCTLCKSSFSTHTEREQHWSLAHPSRSCGLCGKQFDNIVVLRRHIKNNCHGARFRISANGKEKGTDENMVKLLRNEIVTTEGKSGEDNRVPSAEKSTENMGEGEYGTFVEESRYIEDASWAAGPGKIKCKHCSQQFSTPTGMWHHCIDEHGEFYPPGFEKRLRERLERNKELLAEIQELDLQPPETNRNKFFVIMQPKWPAVKSKLTVSIEGNDFSFKSTDNQGTVTDEETSSAELPQNSLSDRAVDKCTTFECEQCGEGFQFASGYREHRSRVHGECFEVVRLMGAFQCSHCTETFPCQFMLDEHLKKHVGKKPLPCTLCGLKFHNIQDRRQHWKTAHPGIGCPNCGKMYASIKYLQKHISLNCQDHFPATKKFLEFRRKQHSDFEMAPHDKRVEKRILKCHLCSKVCCSVHGWRRHMTEAHEDAGFSKLSNTCIMCGEVVYGYKALEKHLLEVHAKESGLPVEEEDFMVQEALKKSQMDILAYRKAGKNSTDIYQDEEGQYHCPHCSKTHPELKALWTHIKTHVNMKLECSICKQTYKNPTLLKQHVQRHRTEAVYKCDTCGKKFMTLQKLNKHNKVHHTKQTFVCELCGMSFSLNDYLLKHKRCHSDSRPHVCSVCAKSFRTKAELRVHALIHTQEQPYTCQYCGRGFTQKGNWRIHLAQHTGEKPYECDQCGLAFALPSHLRRHKVTHDQKINYKCAWCEKECTQRKHMQMHVARVHKEDFFLHEEHMKLENPLPIAASQIKLYNRKLGNAGQVRKAYRTRSRKCNSSLQEILSGIPPKIEPAEEAEVEGVEVEPMVETVGSTELVLPSGEVIVNDEHSEGLIAKDSLSVDKINTGDSSNVQIVMGENNEINIIIQDPSMIGECSVQDLLGGESSDLSHLPEGAINLPDGTVELTTESIQQAMDTFVQSANAGHGVEGEEEEMKVNVTIVSESDVESVAM